MASNYLSAALHAFITCIPADVVKFILLEKVVRLETIRFVQCLFVFFNQKQRAL